MEDSFSMARGGGGGLGMIEAQYFFFLIFYNLNY